MLIDKEEKIKSLIKAIIILLKFIKDNTKMILLIIKYNLKYNLKILILKTYKEVINNPNYNL